MTQEQEIYVSTAATWSHTRWLVLSSLFFLLPSIYAYYYKLYFFFGLLNMTSLISANYWRKATFSWRRNLDLFFAKLAFVIFTVNGFYYINKPFYIVTGYSGFFFIFYLYYLSEIFMKMNDEIWISFHFLFHILLTYEQFIILHSILENQAIM